MTFLNNPEQDNTYYQLNISVGGGPARAIVIDTGSVGILVPLSKIENYSELSPGESYPTPGYSSSNNQYVGKWVKTTVTLTGADNDSVTTSEIIVFGVTGVKEANGQINTDRADGVSFMGVGYQQEQYPTQKFNPFININGLTAGQRQGYIIKSNEVQFGLTDDVTSKIPSVKLEPYPGGTSWQLPTANLRLQSTSDDYQPFSGETPFLVDTGIDYMILTAGETVPGDYTNTQTTPQFVPGVTVQLSVPTDKGIIYSTFATVSGTTNNEPGKIDPAYIRWGKGPATHINTGRHYTYLYGYMYDPDNAVVGFPSLA